uniref:DUF148 domain-containing protein n=1 Tax=Caenorhabditis tropicalis TaxID=1561998 RepID=A0A1I7UY35_9PELO
MNHFDELLAFRLLLKRARVTNKQKEENKRKWLTRLERIYGKEERKKKFRDFETGIQQFQKSIRGFFY